MKNNLFKITIQYLLFFTRGYQSVVKVILLNFGKSFIFQQKMPDSEEN